MSAFEFLEKLGKLDATTRVRIADITTSSASSERRSKPFKPGPFRMGLTSVSKTLYSFLANLYWSLDLQTQERKLELEIDRNMLRTAWNIVIL